MDIVTLVDLPVMESEHAIGPHTRKLCELLEELKLYPQCYEEKFVEYEYRHVDSDIIVSNENIDIVFCFYLPCNVNFSIGCIISPTLRYFYYTSTESRDDIESLLDDANGLEYTSYIENASVVNIDGKKYFQLQFFPFALNNDIIVQTSNKVDILGMKACGIEIFDDELRNYVQDQILL